MAKTTYECQECGHVEDGVQDEPLKETRECPICGVPTVHRERETPCVCGDAWNGDECQTSLCPFGP